MTNSDFQVGVSNFLQTIDYQYITTIMTLNTFNNHRVPLTNTNAHRHQSVFFALFLQLNRGGVEDTRTAHTERMSKCNCTAVRVHPWVVIIDADGAGASEALRCEGFVELNNVYISHCQTCFF